MASKKESINEIDLHHKYMNCCLYHKVHRKGGAIVWIYNVPKDLHVKDFVPSLVLLGDGGNFKRWSILEVDVNGSMSLNRVVGH